MTDQDFGASGAASEPPDAGEPGPLADEAMRLLTSVQDWARRSFGEAPIDGHTGSDCQWCPLCQFVAVLRGDRPDVTERVAEAGTAVVSALRALLDAAATAATNASAGSSASSAGATPYSGADQPRVQKIDLDDER